MGEDPARLAQTGGREYRRIQDHTRRGSSRRQKQEKLMTLYFAYGSNLNEAAMAHRCPKSRKVGPFKLSRARLVFRGVADIEYHKTGKCPGGLWEITRECEKALDRYEGVNTGLYQKVYLKARIRDTGQMKNILVYQM